LKAIRTGRRGYERFLKQDLKPSTTGKQKGFTLVHEIFKSLSPPHHLIQEDVNSNTGYTSYRTSLEKDRSIMIHYKVHFTLVHEIFKSLSPPHHLIQEDVSSHSGSTSYLPSLQKD
jgi:hypothetical protein